MSINSMIGNGLNSLFDLSSQDVTNHAMDLPLQQIETKLTGVTVDKPQTPSIENTSFYKQYEKDKKRNLFKGIVNDVFGSAEQMGGKIGALASAGKFLINDVGSFVKNSITGNLDMSDPLRRNWEQALLIKQENEQEEKQKTYSRTNLLAKALNDNGSSYREFESSQGPTIMTAPQQNFSLDSNGIVQYGGKGTKLNKQDNFDLSLGRFYRNTLEGPNYMNLESYNKNIKDAKLLANKLIDKTPKNSNIPIMQYFIQYKDLPNFKNDYLSLFE